MDKFLQQQEIGKVVDTKNQFTLDRGRSREKLLASIPKGDVHSILRLFDAAVWKLGERPVMSVNTKIAGQNNPASIRVNLPNLSPELVNAFLKELRKPFGEHSGVSLLARATFRASGCHEQVNIVLGSSFEAMMRKGCDIALTPSSKHIPENLSAASKGLQISMLPFESGKFSKHRDSFPRKLYGFLKAPEPRVPLESVTREVSGYFDYRTKPFTAIRSYSCLPSGEESDPSMWLDLWNGPYDTKDPHTAILKKKEPSKFLFLTWRSDYGNPIFLHHFLGTELSFGKHRVKATFWVETTDRPAQVYFFAQSVVSDPVIVKGPPGLSGLVIWPDLKYDIWGTRLVDDDSYRRALEWSQSQVDATATCLSQNLPTVIDRLRSSSLIKKVYLEETIRKLEGFWG